MESELLQLNNFNELSASLVAEQVSLLGNLWKLSQPGIEVEQGPLNSLVVIPSGIASAATITLLDRWRRSTRFVELANSTSDVDAQLLDYLAANYRIERRSGSLATGRIMVEVREFLPFNIDASTTFTVSGLTFTLEYSFSVKTTQEAVLTTTDRLLVPLSNGNYGVSIEAVAANATAAANITKNTEFSTDLDWPYLVKSYAYSSFSGGNLAESNADLAARVINGVALPQLSGRANMQAFLYNQFPTTVADSIVGLGDIEMLRDKSIFPISVGGKADWYVKTQGNIVTQTIAKDATLINTTVGNIGTWELHFDKDDYAGLYEVSEIHRTGSNPAPVKIISRERGLDLSRDHAYQFVPEINTIEEGSYSAYQTYTVRFTDDIPVATGETTRSFLTTVSYMPGISELQQQVNDDQNRPVGTDILVKAAVPCFVSLSIQLAVPYNAQLDTDSIRQQVVNYVNTSKFNGFLAGSNISTIVQNLLPAGSYIKHFNMIGRILSPANDEVIIIKDNDILSIDTPPYVTPKTVGFFSDVRNVFIQVSNF